ncbi:hypothetical protein [Spiroplasma tabanidicola]|uniref:Uncharacterized protein n=1 Tax=Spiroplasma tabanidicola TaxID=324079 RepID=A0A6I6C6K4_9MOLU|nr:hypothetical protein [Spiroplasma tabanidicola]QGS51426.1 hypothetical protein STABA_v1c00590 [Spiroplasma tabanidicola]
MQVDHDFIVGDKDFLPSTYSDDGFLKVTSTKNSAYLLPNKSVVFILKLKKGDLSTLKDEDLIINPNGNDEQSVKTAITKKLKEDFNNNISEDDLDFSNFNQATIFNKKVQWQQKLKKQVNT